MHERDIRLLPLGDSYTYPPLDSEKPLVIALCSGSGGFILCFQSSLRVALAEVHHFLSFHL